MSLRHMIILVAVLALAACTPKNKVREDVSSTQVSVIQPEAAPDTLDYNFLNEEPTIPISESPIEADLPILDSNSEKETSEPLWTIPEDKPEPKATAGLFWVQIFATRSRDKAERIATEAEVRLSHKIETHYLDPYYKVLVGGFATREEAVKLRDRLVNKGYRDAWIFEL